MVQKVVTHVHDYNLNSFSHPMKIEHKTREVEWRGDYCTLHHSDFGSQEIILRDTWSQIGSHVFSFERDDEKARKLIVDSKLKKLYRTINMLIELNESNIDDLDAI